MTIRRKVIPLQGRPRFGSKPGDSFRTEQPDPRRLDPYRLHRELAPRLGFFPHSLLDRAQLLILSLLIPALLRPLLATIDPPPFRGPLHVGVARLGGFFGGSRLGGSRLLVRRCLRRRSRGLCRRNCRL